MTSTKKELKQKENQERLASAIATLDIITKNNNIQRNIRNMVKEVLICTKGRKGREHICSSSKCYKYVRWCNTKSPNAVTY